MRIQREGRARGLLIVSFLAIAAALVLIIFLVTPPSRRDPLFPLLVINGIVLAGIPYAYILWLASEATKPYAVPAKILVGFLLSIVGLRSIIVLVTSVVLGFSPSTAYRATLVNVLFATGLVALTLAYGSFARLRHRTDLPSQKRNELVSIVDEASRELLALALSYRRSPMEAKVLTASDRLGRLKQLISTGNPDAYDLGEKQAENAKFTEMLDLSRSLRDSPTAEAAVERLAALAEELYVSMRTVQQLAGRH